MSSTQSLFKHTFVYGLATVLPKVVNILLTYLLTSYLPGENDFGVVNLVFSYIIFANVILTYGMETAFFRFFHDEKFKNKVLSTALWGLLITTFLALCVALLLIDQLEEWTSIKAIYWRWVIGIIALDTLTVVPFAYLRARGKSIRYSYVKVLNVVISVGLTVVFFTLLPQLDRVAQWLTQDLIELYFIAGCTASAATALLMIGPYFQLKKWDWPLYKKMISYGWPILIAGLAFAINETSDKLFLRWLLDLSPEEAEAQVGIYSAGYRLAIGMTIYAQAFRLGVEPFFFSQAKKANANQQYALITRVFVAFGSVALVCYLVLIDLVKMVMIGEGFTTAMDIVPIVLIGYFFSGIYQTMSVWYKIQDKTIYGAYISVPAAMITIIINILLIPHFGYHACAWATLVAYGGMMAASYIWCLRTTSIPYAIGPISIYLVSAITLGCSYYYVIRPYFEQQPLIGYLIGLVCIALMLALVLKQEQNVVHLVKQKWKK